MLRALADPDRLRIVNVLRDGPRAVKDIAAAVGAPFVNVSHHLKVLRAAGLVRDERQGRFIVYQLTASVFQPCTGPGEPEFLDLGCCRLEIPKSG